jgi:outer membrane protein OmpA-like peptidoglycan-associated protein
MRRLCPWCRWWWFLPAALALSVLGMIGGCGLVERDLTSRTRTALADGNLANVTVDYEYRNAVLRGPASAREAALSAALGLNGLREATYIATDATGAAPASSASVDLTATWNGEQAILRGQVATQAQHDQLVDAAKAEFGADGVVDELTIGSAGSTAALDGAVAALPGVFGRLKEDLRDFSAQLTGTDLAITGTAGSREDVAPLNAFLSDVTGLSVTSQLTAPGATPSPPPPPSAKPAVVQAKLKSILAASTIRFESASANITSESFSILNRVAAVLGPAVRANRALRVSVQGHTDDQAAADFNQRLSEQRATAVVRYLSSKGVSAGKLTPVGFGEAKPVATNATDAGRRANRRIEFKVGG